MIDKHNVHMDEARNRCVLLSLKDESSSMTSVSKSHR